MCSLIFTKPTWYCYYYYCYCRCCYIISDILKIGKNPDARKDWGQRVNGSTEDKMAQWHHQLNGMSWSKLWEIVKDRELWHAAVHGAAKSGTRLSKLNNNKDIYIMQFTKSIEFKNQQQRFDLSIIFVSRTC